MIHSPLLSAIPWLRHGFGTRTDPPWAPACGAYVKQIHSAMVWAVSTPGLAGEGDALLTAEPRLEVAVRTADCYPVLLADLQHRAIAAIHAGWRGTAAQIVPAAIEKMRALYGTGASQILAAIGPGIGVCCYAVGEEVAGQFDAAFLRPHAQEEGRTHLDLAAANRAQLIEHGVPASSISVTDLCTFCAAEQFYSYRREKSQAGRMTSFIELHL